MKPKKKILSKKTVKKTSSKKTIKKITKNDLLQKFNSDSKVIKIIDQYSHSDKEIPKSFNSLQDKHLYKILKIDINFIDNLLKSKKHHGAHIVNTYFKLSGEGKFKGISSKKENSALEKIREKRIKKYGVDYEKTEEHQFDEWDREEEEKEKDKKNMNKIKKEKKKRG